MKDVTEMFQKQNEFCRKDDITFRTDGKNALPKAVQVTLTMGYIQKFYEEVMKRVIGSCFGGDMWIENIAGSAGSFAGIVHLFFDKPATLLKSTALVAYSVWVIILNVFSGEIMVDRKWTYVVGIFSSILH